MVEKEVSLVDEELEDLVIESRVQIKEPLVKFFHQITSGTKKIINYQIPSSGNNLKTWIKSFRGKVISLSMLLVIIIPLLLDDGAYYGIFIAAMIYAIFAASWDLLAGVTGQVSFGHSAFFGIGSYAFAYFLIAFQLHWLVAILLSAIITVVIGLIIAIPALRLKGPYLALGTMAFSLFLYYLFQFPELDAESIDLPLAFKIFRWTNPIQIFIIVLVFMIISVLIILIVYNSKLGTIFKGIRDDETATEASGINTTKYKLYSFMISSFFAGIAGSLYAIHLTNVSFHNYSNLLSFYPVIFTLLGGIGSISGAVMGAFTFAILTRVISEGMGFLSLIFPGLPPAFTTQIETISVFIFAIILLLIIRFTERGVMEPVIRHTKSLWDILLGK